MDAIPVFVCPSEHTHLWKENSFDCEFMANDQPIYDIPQVWEQTICFWQSVDLPFASINGSVDRLKCPMVGLWMEEIEQWLIKC